MLKYVSAVAYVSVEGQDGTRGIGTATHVGEGVYVTARHVVDGKRIIEVSSTEHSYIALPPGCTGTMIHDGSTPWVGHRVHNKAMSVSGGPYFHPHPDVDLAALVVDGLDDLTPWGAAGRSPR